MARRTAGKKIGTKVSGDSTYMFGTDEEIAHRDQVAFQPSPTSFSQIAPGDRGGNLNNPSRAVKSGNFKFNPNVS